MRPMCMTCSFYRDRKKGIPMSIRQKKAHLIGRILQGLKEQDMKRNELAKALNVSGSYVTQLLTNHKPITTQLLMKIEDVLDISLLRY